MCQQNYAGDLECILVDDCTPDRSMYIANSLIESYHGPIQFRILRNPENQGLSCSRNNGFSIAKGDYVFFLDSDDYISDDCINSLSKQLYLYDCEIDLVVGNSYEYQNGAYWQKFEDGVVTIGNHTQIMRKFLLRQVPMMAWNKLIRRHFLLSHNLQFAPQMVHEDELWSFQLYDVVETVVLIPDVTYFYEQNANSIMNSSDYIQHRMEACQSLVYNMLESLDNKDLYVEKCFWGIHMYMLAEDMFYRFHNELVERNITLRRQMFFKTVKDGRWVLSLFLILTIMPPFCSFIRFRWFRHNYHVIKSIFYKLALVFDFVHCK